MALLSPGLQEVSFLDQFCLVIISLFQNPETLANVESRSQMRFTLKYLHRKYSFVEEHSTKKHYLLPGDLSEFDLENTSGFIINDISLAFTKRTLSSDKLRHSSNDLRKVTTSLTLWEMEHVNSPFCK